MNRFVNRFRSAKIVWGKKSVLAWCMLSKTQNILLGQEKKMPSLFFLGLPTDGLAS